MLIMILSTHAPTIDMKIKEMKKRDKKKKFSFFYINLQGSNALNPSAILAQ